MALIPARCTNCGANIQVDNTKEAGICESCGTAFITEKAINNYVITNNINVAHAEITVNSIDVDGRISAAERLMNKGLFNEGRQMLFNITKDCPEDYRAWFLLAKYAYQLDDLWLDDNPHFHRAKALAPDDGLAIIIGYYNEMHARIVDTSKDIVDFCETPDLSKLFYCYLKWYYSETFDESSGYGYWGFEPVNGHPAMVSYTKNKRYGYVRHVLATDCQVVTHFHKKKTVGVIMSENRCVWLPQHVKNEFSIDRGIGVDISSRFDTCRIFITGFNGGKVVYNDNPDEIVYGNVFKNQSTDFEKTDGCYVATCVYGSYDCPQVWTLRRFRDDTLGSTWYGRVFIRTYYAISPTLVKWFGNTNWFKNMWRGTLDKMVNKLNTQGVEDTPYKDKEWRK